MNRSDKSPKIPVTKPVTLEDILKDSGISLQHDYNLILWNDNVNDMINVVVSLYEVCKLSNEHSQRVMMEAHTKGKSLAKNGELDELLDMKNGLNARGLSVTIEEAV
jgi:ATP-dependent Clp protease adapter protein ClpS